MENTHFLCGFAVLLEPEAAGSWGTAAVLSPQENEGLIGVGVKE